MDMKVVLKNIITDEIIVELIDNLDVELTYDEVQDIINNFEFEPEELEHLYVDYI